MKKISFILIAILVILLGAYILLIPKSTLTMGIDSIYLNDEGELKYEENIFGIYRKELKKEGINLRFKSPSKLEAPLTPFELMERDPEIDFVLITNTNVKPPNIKYEKYRSFGTVDKTPVYFYEKKASLKNKTIFISDLGEKKLAYFSWTHQPEEFNFYNFQWQYGADKPIKIHPFSYEAAIKIILDPSMNKRQSIKLFNPFPEKELNIKMDWDLLLTPHLPYGLEGMTGVDNSIPNALFVGDLKLRDFSDFEAFVLRNPSFKLIEIPAGLIQPRFKIPDKDIKVIASEQSILAKKNIDTGLAISLADVLQKTHFRGTVFNKRGSYPYFSDYEVFDPNEDVKNFYKDGRPFLSHYFPLRYAVLLHQIFLILLPILTIGVPLFKLLPSIYEIYVKNKFESWYKRLRDIEYQYEYSPDVNIEALKNQVKTIDEELLNFKFKFANSQYVQEIYIVREHVNLIKAKIYSRPE